MRTLNRIPQRLAAAVDCESHRGSARVDAFLTEQSTRFPPATTERLARHLLATLDPSGTDRYDLGAFARRSLTCAVDSTGMLVSHFQLDPAAGRGSRPPSTTTPYRFRPLRSRPARRPPVTTNSSR